MVYIVSLLIFLCSCSLRVFFFFFWEGVFSRGGLHTITIQYKQFDPWTITTIPSQSETGSNGNEDVLHTPRISKSKASPLDKV